MGLKTAQRQLVASITPVQDGVDATTGAKKGPHGTAYGPEFKASASNDNYYFTQISGGEVTASVERVYSGGSHLPEVLCAPAEIGDITITGNFEDSGFIYDNIKKLRELVGRVYYQIDVYMLDCGLKMNDTQRTYTPALLVGLTEPEGDASSGAPNTFALTFAVSSVSGYSSAS
jgi:hypothetical protein